MEKPLISGRYEVQEELSSTSRVRLLAAREAGSGQSRVLQELQRAPNDPTFPERMAREVELLQTIQNPTIPAVVGAFEDGEHYYLVREYMGGMPLVRYRADNPDAVKSRAEGWINSLADVLEDLHSFPHGSFVVGEFGPEDLLITGMGRLRFLPVRLETLQAPDVLEGVIPGAPAESSPPFFDVHCLIRLAWWMLTGEVPVLGKPQRPLYPSAYPDLSPSWLKGLEAAVNPTFPAPPQTMHELRKLLLGEELVSSELPPKLECEVDDIRFVRGGKMHMVQGVLRIRNTGGGELTGYCRSTQRWVRVVPNSFRGNEVELEFWIDSSGMRADEQHQAQIVLKSQNEEIELPVQVNTEPHWLSQLPDLVAGVLPFLPGTVLILLSCMMLWTAQASAVAALEELHEGPLGQSLTEALLKAQIGAGETAPINAHLAAAGALLAFAACPFFVYRLVRHYPPSQRKRLLPAEGLAMASPWLWLGLLWGRPTFNHFTTAHPAFAVMDLKGPNMWMFAVATLVSTGWFFTPVHEKVEAVFRGLPLLRRTLAGVLLALLLAMATWLMLV